MSKDVSGKELERVKFAFSIYDFEGNEKIDGFYLGDCLRALKLNPTMKIIEKLGGQEKKKVKMIALADFLPIYTEVKKDSDAGGFEDFMEVLKLYDKNEDGTMILVELEHILTSLGERLERTELDPVMALCCPEEDEEGNIPYEPFLKKLCAMA